MSKAMTNDTGDDGPSETVRTNVEVDRQPWRQVRTAAITDGINISETLGEILRERFEGSDDTNENIDDGDIDSETMTITMKTILIGHIRSSRVFTSDINGDTDGHTTESYSTGSTV